MNRSILIVICDFLLVSLLAFSSVDIKPTVEGTPRQQQLKLEMTTNQAESGKDVAAMMRQALDEERKSRDQLMGELSRTRETVTQQQAMLDVEKAKTAEAESRAAEQKARLAEAKNQLNQAQTRLTEQEARLARQESRLSEQQALLGAREEQVRSFQTELKNREDLARRLQDQQAALQQQLASAQTNLSSLNQQLHDTSVQAVITGEKYNALQDQARRQAEQAELLRKQLDSLSHSNLVVQAEKEHLSTQLQVAEVEKRFAAQQTAYMQDEVKAEREEKAKLAEGIKALATRSDELFHKSTELVQEVRETHPLAPNTIFNQFSTNCIQARFSGVRSGLLGEAIKSRETQTILVTDGTNTYALCHVRDTPLALSEPGTDWDGLTGLLSRNMVSFAIHSVAFCTDDPRIVLIPVPSAEVHELGAQPYRLSQDPFRFQDAILIGTHESYYGECRFQVDLAVPDYLKLDRNFIKGIFGKFNPSRGDLVFSHTGELLGVMANDTYCMILRNFDAGVSFPFSQDLRAQHTGVALSALYSQVLGFPAKVQ